jgi:glycosyltransferase involved in cell wall biosynthesis
MTKKIAVDARMYGLSHGGIGRYVKNLLKNLDQKELEITFLVREKALAEIKNDFKDKFEYQIINARHYSLKEQLVLPFFFLKHDYDLVHFPHFNVPLLFFGKFVVTIHDLIKHQSRGVKTTTRSRFLYWLKYLFYRVVFSATVKKAKQIITPTEWVKQELADFYPSLDLKKITVVSEGVEAVFKEKISPEKRKQIVEKHHLTKPFLLYVGSVYPHKNVIQLVKAVRQLNQEGVEIMLAVVCSRNIFLNRLQKQLKKLDCEQFVKLLGFARDKELAGLYQAAAAFVTPSLMEGFGLPGIEAMQVGCPVIAADSSCFPEVYQEAAVYFDPHNLMQLKKRITTVLEDKKLKNELINKGRNQAEEYDWKKTAAKTKQIYLEEAE